ncbi:MAG TPA: calcium-binding protein [Polyangiaceae bacterium]|nr:calcium-binding protein [Polyangiaceae bacterium]
MRPKLTRSVWLLCLIGGLGATSAGCTNSNVSSTFQTLESEPDTDADGLADSVDPCPTGLENEGTPLVVDEPSPQYLEFCTPEPQSVQLVPPQVHGACEPPLLRARLVQVNGHTLAEPRDATEEQLLLLPMGSHRLTWSVRDSGGKLYATREVGVELRHTPSARCATADQFVMSIQPDAPAAIAWNATLWLGSDEADLLLGSANSDFIWGSTNDDYLASRGGNDVILGGPGNDYLTAAGGGNVMLFGGAGADVIHAQSAARAVLYGGTGADVLIGSAGDDVAFAGPETRLVALGNGDDALRIEHPCELESEAHWDGGPGDDTLYSPVDQATLERAGVRVDGFEHIVVDTSRGYLSECFTWL